MNYGYKAMCIDDSNEENISLDYMKSDIDSNIIDMYLKRDECAIEITEKVYGKYLYKISFNILHNRLDCEECVNDTYMRAWNSIPPQRPIFLRAYLCKIVRGISIDRYNLLHCKKRILSELTTSLDELDDIVDLDENPQNLSDSIDVSRVLSNFLKNSKEDERFAFVCRYYYGYSVENIAYMLKKSESKIYKLLASMRKNLRQKFNEEGIIV